MQKTSKGTFARRLKHCCAGFTAMAFMLSAPCCQNGTSNRSASREVFAMDTFMNVSCYGANAEKAADAAVNEINRIDALLSITSNNGSIYRVNKSKKAEIDDETALIIEKALEINRNTSGAFDITVLPLMNLWGFTSGQYRVPSKGEIDEALAHVGSEQLSLSGGELSIGDAIGIDLGGIAKGYTSDRLMEVFRENGISSACISLGGNAQCLGAKTDGTPWCVGIVHPFKRDSGEFLGLLYVIDKAVITSGAYERNFIDENSGKRYHHIIDPKTGYPAESGLASVTIVSDSGILADALSTSIYIMGLNGAIEYWKRFGKDFDMVLMTDSGDIYITQPLAESFSSDAEVYIIS